MKKKFFLFIMSLAIIISTYSSAGGVSIGFQPNIQNFLPGSNINIDIMIWDLGDSASPSLSAFDIDVAYDPMVLSFIAYKLSSYLGDISSGDISSYEAWDQSYGEQSLGTINLAELSLLSIDKLNSSQPSQFALATLTFKANALGLSTLDLTIHVLGDEKGDPLSFQVCSGNINIVPIPATILLFGSSIACFITERFMGSRKRGSRS